MLQWIPDSAITLDTISLTVGDYAKHNRLLFRYNAFNFIQR